MRFEDVFASLVKHDRWIVWREIFKGGPKPAKVPWDPRGNHAIDAQDASNWLSYAEARLLGGDKIGYVHGDGEHFFLDLDDCGDTHAWLARFPGAAVERSHGGMGLHVVGRAGNLGFLEHSTRCAAEKAELYTQARFMAIGTPLSGSSATDCTGALTKLVVEHFPPKTTGTRDDGWTDEPVDEYTGPPDDDTLIDLMLGSRGSVEAQFQAKASIQMLWNGDEDELAPFFPSSSGDGFDRSAADAALASHLAFWTGKDCERMVALLHRSGLERDKLHRWDYMQRTVLFAKSTCTRVYDRVESPSEQLVTDEEERIQFEDFVWVLEDERFYNRVTGETFTEPGFNKWYGHQRFSKPGGGLWKPSEAFLYSHQKHTKVHATCFDPLLEPGAIVEDDTPGGMQKLLNVWRGIPTPYREGTPTPWLDHIHAMYEEGDAAVLLAVLAGFVQHVGYKCPWLPVQYGPEGNGKSTITEGMIRVFGGNKLTTTLRPQQIGRKFNSNVDQKVLAVIDDVNRLGPSSMEALKSMITSYRLEVEYKGSDARMVHTCCNYIANTNYIGAIPKTHNDRRIAVLCSRQKDRYDVERDFSAAYFEKLYRWLDQPRNVEMLHGWLRTYEIPGELDFRKGAIRAPETSGAEEARDASHEDYVQIIREAIAERELGFRGGWVSSNHARRICEARNVRLAPNQMKVAARVLDYEEVGRATRNSPIERGRPRIYRKRGLPTPEKNWLDAYERAQKPPDGDGGDVVPFP